MANWYDITRDEEYQSLSQQAKADLKQQFFQRTFAADAEYGSLSDSGKQAVFQSFMQQPDDTGQNIVTSTLGSAARGFGEVVPGAIEGVGALTGIEEIRGAGQAVRGGLEYITPTNPIYEEGIPAKVANVGGQVGSIFATAGVGGLASKTLAGAKIAAGATAAEQAALASQAIGRGAKAASYLSSGLQGAAGGANEAERYGLEGPEAYLRTLAGAATELGSEALPFGTLAETAAARRLLGETVQGAPGIRQAAFAEGAEEAAAQIGGNVATQALAPLGTETPGLLEGVPEAAGLGAVGGGMFGALNRLTTPRTPTVATPPPVQPATADVAANVAATDEGEVAPIAAPDVGTPVTLDGQNYTVSIPSGSSLSPDALAGFYDDPETLQALHDRGDIRLEQIIAPTETVDTTPLNNNIASSASFAPQTVAAMTEIADVEASGIPAFVENANATRDRLTANTGISNVPLPISQPAVTPAQETPVAPAESDGGSLGGLQTEVEGSIPTVTAATVPQEPVVSSAEIAPAGDPFAGGVRSKGEVASEVRRVDEESAKILSSRVQELKGQFPGKAVALRFGELPDDGVSTGVSDQGRLYEEAGVSTYGLLDVAGVQLQRENNAIGDTLVSVKDRQPYIIVGDLSESKGRNREPLLSNVVHVEPVSSKLVAGFAEQSAGRPQGSFGAYLRGVGRATQSEPPAPKPVKPKRPKKSPAPPAAGVEQQPIEETPAATVPQEPVVSSAEIAPAGDPFVAEVVDDTAITAQDAGMSEKNKQTPRITSKAERLKYLKDREVNTSGGTSLSDAEDAELAEILGQLPPATRDPSKPEQMLPREVEKAAVEKKLSEGVGARLKGANKKSYVLGVEAGARREHRSAIADAFDDNKPVSTEAVDTYGIELPEGYARQGELYIFQPASGQPDLGAGDATTPQGAIETPTTPLAGKAAPQPVKPKRPKKAPAPPAAEVEQPIEETPAAPTPLAGPLRPRFEAGEIVAFKVNGQPVMGTIQRVSGGGSATVTYNWNGKKEQEIVLRTSEIQRPVLAVAEEPNYKYTQEQNARKAARFGLPTEPGVTVGAGSVIKNALARIASDTAMPQMLRAVARALQNQNYDGVDLRIEADGRRWYAGYYLNDNGITEIGINLRLVGRGQVDAVSVLLHEALHHVTLAKVRDPQGEIETQAVEALDTLRKRIKVYAGLQQKATKFSYELGTVDEFITALFTRPDFQDFIAGIPDTFTPGTPGSKFRSALSEIFRIIAQLVTGQKVQKGGILDQSFASTLALFETPQRAARGQSVDYTPTEGRDAEYMAAVEAGDMEKAQRMVDEAAKAAGYDVGPVYHGTEQEGLTEFFGGWWSDQKATTKEFGRQMYSAFLRGPLAFAEDLRPLYVEFNGTDVDPDSDEAISDSELGDAAMSGGPFSRFVQEKGFQGIAVWDESNAVTGMAYAVFNPNQIKSADPVTRDDAGNVIPLSQRFQSTSPDIRFSATDDTANAEPTFTPDEARAILTKRFGKAVADKFNIEVMAPRRMGNREVEVDAELRGGTISLNLKFMDSEELLIQKAEHEMAHAVFSDKGVQDAWRELSASMPPDVRTRITDRMKEAGYDYRVLNEEVLVRFLEEVRANTSPSKWKAFMDAVIDAFRRFFGAMPDERTARLAAARIIAAGEAAVARGLDPSKQAFGQSVSDLLGKMDAEYMAAIEAGDMEKAQRMVDEAAKAAGYDVGPVFHHGGFNAEEDAVPRVGDEGMHFGTKDAATERAYGKQVDDFIKEADITFDDDLDAWFWSSQGVDSYDVVDEEGFPSEDAARRSLEGFASSGEVEASAEELGTFTRAFLKAGEAIAVDDQKDSWHKAVAKAKANGATAIKYRNLFEDRGSTSYIVFSPEQIKSADPVTRDDAGNVIPLSKRFGPSPDIRFSVATPRGYAFQRNLSGEAATMKNLVVRRPWKETLRLAREIIEPYKKEDPSKDKMAGREKALRRLMTDTDIDPNVRTAGLMLLALEADTLASVAKTPEDQARYDDFANIPVNAYGVLESSPDPASVKLESVTELMQMGSGAGRLLNSFKLIAAMSPDGFNRRVERVRQKKVNEATEQQFGVNPQRLLELMWSETEKAEKAAVEKAKAELKRRSPEAIAKAAIARLNEMMAGPPRPRGKPSEISEMIRKHLNSPVEGFIDKLVALGVEKETAEALDAISGTVRADLAKLAEANAVKRLTESLKPKTRAAKSAIPRLLRVLLEAGKTGAFDSKAFNDALGEAFDFPPMTAEQEAEIKRMVTEINKLPQGAARVDKQQELQNYVALVQGVPARDMLLSALYANWLSGLSTQAIGLAGNSANMGLRSFFLFLTSHPEDFANYLRGALGAGLRAGAMESKAALGSFSKWAKNEPEQVRGQFKVGKLDNPEIANALEVLLRKGPSTPAEWVAYVASFGTRMRAVFRVMTAIDTLFWNSAREGMYHLAASRTARKTAKEKGMTKEEANAEFIRQLGGGPEVFEEALRDAEAELKKAGQPADMLTMTRMAYEAIDKARVETNPEAVVAANRFAFRMVLQQEPEGSGKLISKLISVLQKELNVAGFPLGQMLVPYNKIVSNLFEQSLDYTGLGIVRWALGMHISDARIDWSRKGMPGIAPVKGATMFSETEARERAMAGFVGLTLSAAAYVAAKANMDDDDDEAPFMIYAFGPTDKNKRDQMPDGWSPFSIKIGNTYYRYAEWPLGMVLAGFGAALDAERYGNMKEKDTLDRIGYSAMLGLKGFMTQGVLSNVDTAIDVIMFKATGKKYTDIPINAAKGLIPAQGALRDISRMFDNTKISNDDVASALIKDIPVVKSWGTKPELNVFGEPVMQDGVAVLSRFVTQRRPHAEADYLTRNKLYIPGMDETVTIGQYLPPTERDRFKRRAMQMDAMENGVFTAEQNYNFRKRAGELTKSAVQRVMKQAPAVRTEEQRKAVQSLIDKQVGLARRRAMVEAVPYQPPPAQ